MATDTPPPPPPPSPPPCSTSSGVSVRITTRHKWAVLSSSRGLECYVPRSGKADKRRSHLYPVSPVNGLLHPSIQTFQLVTSTAFGKKSLPPCDCPRVITFSLASGFCCLNKGIKHPSDSGLPTRHSERTLIVSETRTL